MHKYCAAEVTTEGPILKAKKDVAGLIFRFTGGGGVRSFMGGGWGKVVFRKPGLIRKPQVGRLCQISNIFAHCNHRGTCALYRASINVLDFLLKFESYRSIT